jgi:hypothetical protein
MRSIEMLGLYGIGHFREQSDDGQARVSYCVGNGYARVLVCNIRPLMAPYCLRNATFDVDGPVCR